MSKVKLDTPRFLIELPFFQTFSTYSMQSTRRFFGGWKKTNDMKFNVFLDLKISQIQKIKYFIQQKNSGKSRKK